MSTPGVEPGLLRPQRDVLTTRRCGPLHMRKSSQERTSCAQDRAIGPAAWQPGNLANQQSSFSEAIGIHLDCIGFTIMAQLHAQRRAGVPLPQRHSLRQCCAHGFNAGAPHAPSSRSACYWPHQKNEARAIRTPNLLIWSQTRCHCAIAPLVYMDVAATYATCVAIVLVCIQMTLDPYV